MHIYLLLILIILILLILLFINNKIIIDNFDNLVPDLYTWDTCCNDMNFSNCRKYGKTGVCNYFKKDNSCMCQNAY